MESDHKDSSGYPKLPKARRLGESPHGSFLGRTMSISIRRESRVAQPSSSLRDRASRPSFPSPYYHEGHT